MTSPVMLSPAISSEDSSLLKKTGKIFLFAFLLILFCSNTLEGQSSRIQFSDGEFIRGQKAVHATEQPPHKVILSPFELDIYEVTNDQFAQFIQAGGYQNRTYWSEEGWNQAQKEGWQCPRYWRHPDYNDPRQPVVGITWYEAAAYCRWRGNGTRLPTEAEWEYAASQGGKWEYPWGQRDPEGKGTQPPCHFLNLSSTKRSFDYPLKIGTFPPSPGGFYDLAGNVWEWCSDWYGKDYYQHLTQNPQNPQGPPQGEKKVLRGGAFNSTRMTLRASVRYGSCPENWYRSVGFRTACSLEKK